MDSSTIQELIQVYFLLQHGWEYDPYDNSWSKDGFTREVDVDCGRCSSRGCRKPEKVKNFDLVDAYEAQKDYVETAVEHVMSM